jgi:hypothetical protein
MPPKQTRNQLLASIQQIKLQLRHLSEMACPPGQSFAALRKTDSKQISGGHTFAGLLKDRQPQTDP